MLRAFMIAAPLVLAPVAVFAQQPSTTSQTSAGAVGQRDCQVQQPSMRRQMARGMLGALAGGMLGRVGGVAMMAVPAIDVLGDAIMRRLDCREQERAVQATSEAVRGGVGTTVNWQSETRPGVTGSSVATGEERLADGTHCMTVTDIVIVDGEETRAPKRMCRAPGAQRYARV